MTKDYMRTVSFYQGIDGQLMPDEQVIWRGKPKKSAFVLNSSIKMAPFAILWLMIDCSFIVPMFGMGSALGTSMIMFMVPFFAIHLMPVWIWLYNMFTAWGRWKNTEYVVTNMRVIMQNGLVGYEFQSIYYTDISNVSLHVGAIDRMLGVGDIYCTLRSMADEDSYGSAQILDVENPEEVYALVQRTVLDMQTDIHYPNALRPEKNPGYHTQYRP